MSDGQELVGRSPAWLKLTETLSAVAPTPLPVTLHGETGTGKEVAARWLHEQSGRRGPFIPVDCAAMSPTLVESELFGHERGAFTGADRRRTGLVAAASRGTFFLDEVAELPLEVQTRLLRLLQEGTYRPVGGSAELEADVRVVAASWKDLAHEVRAGRFRQDLYHRLSVVVVHLPPLRERPEDVPLLFETFLREEIGRLGRAVPRLAPEARAQLLRWPWPGNVRELRNAARYVAALCDGPRIEVKDFPPSLQGPAPERVARDVLGDLLRADLPYMEARRQWLDAFQLHYIRVLLEEHEGNISRAARAAQMDRRSIQRMVKRLREVESSEE